MHQADQTQVDGALVDQESCFAELLNTARDTVAVKRPHGVEGFQDHEIESALQNVGFRFSHLWLLWVDNIRLPLFLWDVKRCRRRPKRAIHVASVHSVTVSVSLL